ncbi:hypothetical protein F3Y22_tig00110893pilonHSYRG00180 [Hibiscus syriacus]|uniref:Kinesin motor domain-containing protein n=1 Tax=Hibiscus syriacus TaxID=106335 RepID=A0A6A2ZG10_HIBSY|nr:hypothetical protein F3Y22_tig00110893pilonHSYRG00180 [Hibiscus syriacus]
MCQGSSGYNARTPVAYAPEEIVGEPVEGRISADSISVTIRFRPLNEREFQRGDEIAWYADGDKIVRHDNPATAYAFEYLDPMQLLKRFMKAAKPVVKAAMEGVNGMKTELNIKFFTELLLLMVLQVVGRHTMHGDQTAPGITIGNKGRVQYYKIVDYYACDPDSRREFLLRVSYLEIYNEVINDLIQLVKICALENAQWLRFEKWFDEVADLNACNHCKSVSYFAYVGITFPGNLCGGHKRRKHRHVGSNNFNLFSSRSHTIFTLMIESSAHGDEYDGVNLIDLAGSESSKTETTGLRRKEGSYINKSLLTLGTVVKEKHPMFHIETPAYPPSAIFIKWTWTCFAICTVTPASSNMEETHNTLKFASRAKRVEIYASRNKIIDEKSLIKKYQKEISVLKLELDQLRQGVLEEGQVKMQSRLEEEEKPKLLDEQNPKAYQLILVSSKNSIPGFQTRTVFFIGSSSFPSGNYLKIKGSSVVLGWMTSDQMDLLVEQVKMLLEKLHLAQIQNLEREIHEKRRQMRVLEQRIMESGEDSIANASFVDMQQCSENEELQKKVKLLAAEKIQLTLAQSFVFLAPGTDLRPSCAYLCRTEMKNEVTKLSVQNAKLEKELLAAQELANTRGSANLTVNGFNRKYSDSTRAGKGAALWSSGDGFESWNLDLDDLKMELQARKQREAALEAVLTEKEFIEDEYRKRVEEAKKGRHLWRMI